MNMTMASRRHHVGRLRRARAGFTLVESVVAAMIIIILSGTMVVGIYSGRRASTLRDAAGQFASDLREAETLTQDGVKGPECLAQHGVDPRCSVYWVVFSQGASTYTRQTGWGTDKAQTSLPGGATMHMLNTGSSNVGFTFTYTPPLISVVSTVSMPATISVKDTKSGSTQNVCVYGNGRIEIRQASQVCS